MRTTALHRSLLSALVLLAAACDNSDSTFEPPAVFDAAPEAAPEAEPVPEDPRGLAAGRWADGYALAQYPLTSSYAPPPQGAYNRSGGPITVTKVAGTTGRYVVTFAGLSSLVGSRNTVRVTSHGTELNYCKPMTGSLASDKVEVRCFKPGTGSAANASFSVLVLGRTPARAYAYGNQPTAASYSAPSTGSYNPAGTTRITRLSPGTYQVVFNSLGTGLAGHAGQVQVNAVASAKAYCKLMEEWGRSTDVVVNVQCYGASGAPMDAKFSVLFLLPAARLGYTYANQPTATQYTPDPLWSTNPDGSGVIVTRLSAGTFEAAWFNAMDDFIDYGNIQVTAVGMYDNAQCKIRYTAIARAGVQCFAANGVLVDVPFTVLLGS